MKDEMCIICRLPRSAHREMGTPLRLWCPPRSTEFKACPHKWTQGSAATEWRTDIDNVPEYPAEFLIWHGGAKGYACVTVKGSGEFDYDQEPTITHWAEISTPPETEVKS